MVKIDNFCCLKLEIFLSVHAQTSEAVILHLNRNSVKCLTYTQRFGQFV